MIVKILVLVAPTDRQAGRQAGSKRGADFIDCSRFVFILVLPLVLIEPVWLIVCATYHRFPLKSGSSTM